MKKGQIRKTRTTSIYFTEADTWVDVTTSNRSLKKRLKRQTDLFPETCLLKEVDGDSESYLIMKKNISFRFLPPINAKHHEAAIQRGYQYGFKKSN